MKKTNRQVAEEIFENGDFIPGTAVETYPGSMVFVNTAENREKVINEITKALDQIRKGDYEEVEL